MQSHHNHQKRETLWKRYWSIVLDRRPGLCEPILWHLALSGDPSAMVTLADTFATDGRITDSYSRSGLYYRAHKRGYTYAAQHLAMDSFNRGDLGSYRYWLRRAARFDPAHLQELKRFETRLPHQIAKERGRGRPYRRYDRE